MPNEKKIKSVSYAKWGYIFILPFFLTYAIFSVIPLVDTIRNSFYEYYYSGLKAIGPNWVGFANYAEMLAADLPKYAWNTFVMWILGFIPQIVVALVLASWFTDARLKIRGKQFFKVVIYLPNLIMASAFAMLFFALFSNAGPVNSVYGVHLRRPDAGGADELPHVVRQHHHHADGGHHGHQSLHF